MLKKLWLNLQLFADGGGDGGDGGSASASVGEAVREETSGEIEIPAFIPEKAKKTYQKAVKKHSGSTTNATTENSDNAQTTNGQSTTDKIPYKDLIKSDDYKDDHKAYMDETIGERLKKYKGIEEQLAKQKEMLDAVATKYGINPDDENFNAILKEKIDADDSYYENYAMEHDISNEEARQIVTMQRKAERYDAEKAEQERVEQARQQIMTLRQNAEKTKKLFPDFDLDAEMQNEQFRRLCAATNGDTTAAYKTCHWDEIVPATVQMASKKIQAQTAQAVASNQARPIENGLSSAAPSVVQQNFKGMSLKELRAYKDEHFR
jgi:hypothetical protein